MTKIKLCGLRKIQDVEAANEVLPEYAGFVFAKKSRRYVSPEEAYRLKQRLSPEITAVGVFTEEDLSKVAELLEKGVIDVAQLHGRESEAYIRELKERTGKPVIKAFSMDREEALLAAESCCADFVLLDSGKGGTGTAFDWRLAKRLARPYFLAGGLDQETVGQAIAMLHPYGVDVSSGIETGGEKDPEKMQAFALAVRDRKDVEV